MSATAPRPRAAVAARCDRAVVADDEYRDLMSNFPTGVAVVTSLDAGGRPRGMTCSSLVSVTLRPPTLSVCLRNASGTLEAVLAHGRFAVNLLGARGRRTAELFSSPVPDRFAQVAWRPSSWGLPWLHEDALGLAQCRLSGTMTVGDHTLVLGRVGAVQLCDDTPLLYGLRRFSVWPEAAAAEPGQASA